MRRQWRLCRREDFARVRQTGQTVNHLWFALGRAANGLPHNRYGIIVTKRLGSAVVRNRTRRRLREALRHLHPRLVQGYDLVLVVRQPVAHQPYDQLSSALVALLQQARLLKSGD
ncbi:MAG: ribonuclease P protein component [Anaerolineae bacterium]|nr:ribonuclease P protein component [Anaerolineae bacterium]MDW8173066.1 ribonuclease P protein component [Anaerolineae bacterium]